MSGGVRWRGGRRLRGRLRVRLLYRLPCVFFFFRYSMFRVFHFERARGKKGGSNLCLLFFFFPKPFFICDFLTCTSSLKLGSLREGKKTKRKTHPERKRRRGKKESIRETTQTPPSLPPRNRNQKLIQKMNSPFHHMRSTINQNTMRRLHQMRPNGNLIPHGPTRDEQPRFVTR